MTTLQERVAAHFAESILAKQEAEKVLVEPTAQAAELMLQCLMNDGKILACGNGGSGAPPPEREILTVPNEVTMPEEPAPRRSVELGRDTLRIVGIGGLIERKRPDLAVEAAAALAQRGAPAPGGSR